MAYPIYRVFVSSTFTDLVTERAAAVTAILDVNSYMSNIGVGIIPVDLARGSTSRPPLPQCLEDLRTCDFVITLVASRYGTTLPDGRSFSYS